MNDRLDLDLMIEDMCWAYGFEAEETLAFCQLIADNKPKQFIIACYIISMYEAGWLPREF